MTTTFQVVAVVEGHDDLAGFGFGERAADGGTERCPGAFVDVGFQRSLQPRVRVVAAVK